MRVADDEVEALLLVLWIPEHLSQLHPASGVVHTDGFAILLPRHLPPYSVQQLLNRYKLHFPLDATGVCTNSEY